MKQRLKVSIDKNTIVFFKWARNTNTGNYEYFQHSYKTTPKRIVAVVYASSKYTHYQG